MNKSSAELFEGNLHLAKKITHKIMRFGKTGIEFDDVHQEALMGLDKASKNYDPNNDSNVTFERFAISVMYTATLRFMMYKHNALHTSKDVIELAVTINKRKMVGQTAEEIAKALNAKQHRVELALRHLKQQIPVSIYTPVPGADSGDLYYVDTIADNIDTYNPDLLDLKMFINTLEPVAKKIVTLRANGMSQEEISRIVGGSQMKVSRIMKKVKGQYDKYMGIS